MKKVKIVKERFQIAKGKDIKTLNDVVSVKDEVADDLIAKGFCIEIKENKKEITKEDNE